MTSYICGVWCVQKSDRWRWGIPFLHSWQPTGISHGGSDRMGPKGWLGCVYVVIYRASSWSDAGLTKCKKYLLVLLVNFQELYFGISQWILSPIRILQVSLIVKIYDVPKKGRHTVVLGSLCTAVALVYSHLQKYWSMKNVQNNIYDMNTHAGRQTG